MLRIDKIMKDKGISAQDLGHMMHVAPQYVSAVANEKKNITIAGLEKFAKALDVPMVALFDGYVGSVDSSEENINSFTCPYCGHILKVE